MLMGRIQRYRELDGKGFLAREMKKVENGSYRKPSFCEVLKEKSGIATTLAWGGRFTRTNLSGGWLALGKQSERRQNELKFLSL